MRLSYFNLTYTIKSCLTYISLEALMQIKQPAPTHDESLSFDLMTALAGDDVEFKGVNGWESINAHRLSKEMILTGYYKNMNLRMKHPQLEIL